MSEFSRYVTITVFVFTVSLAAGVGVAMADPAGGQEMLNLLKEAIFGGFAGKTSPELAATLFVNNLQACIFMFLGGASFGVLTAFIILTNGVVIGAVMEIVREEQGGLFVAAALLPHGIFEIPAFIISGTLGFLLAKSLYLEWNGRDDAGAKAMKMGRSFLLFVVPLVAVAAVTEAFITPEIINLVA